MCGHWRKASKALMTVQAGRATEQSTSEASTTVQEAGGAIEKT
jgi:hypothetical protein